VNGLGCELIDLGIVPDTLEATEAALAQAASLADVVVTSGGVSVAKPTTSRRRSRSSAASRCGRSR